MKKMNNKGFSMVELIIVIAIMAILAGALAPTLIKYVNKSRMSSDVSNAQTIAGSVQAAYSDPSSYDSLPTGSGYTLASILALSGSFGDNLKGTLGDVKTTPKYKKAITLAAGGTATPDEYFIKIDDKTATGGAIAITVYADKAQKIQLYPETESAYLK